MSTIEIRFRKNIKNCSRRNTFGSFDYRGMSRGGQPISGYEHVAEVEDWKAKHILGRIASLGNGFVTVVRHGNDRYVLVDDLFEVSVEDARRIGILDT